MPRASRVSNPPAAAAKNVSSNGGHSDSSCSASVYQSLRPVTRSMTRAPAAVEASPDLKGVGSGSRSTRKSTSDASFSIQSASLQPTVTRSRTAHKVTTSAWKPLTQPVALSEGQKCASRTTMNPTAKRSRVASTRAAKDSTSHSASKATSIVVSGKKNRDEESTSQGDQSDAAVIPSPTKKLQTCNFPSDTCSKRVSSIRILGGKVPAPLSTVKLESETGTHSASVSANVVSASANDVSLSPVAIVPLPAQQLQPNTAQNSSVITESVNKEASQVQQLSAKVIKFPRQKLQTDYQKMPSSVPMTTNQASGLAAGAAASMALPKLQIGNIKDTSNVLSNPNYARALLIRQQQQMLLQHNLGISQQQQQMLQQYNLGSSQQQQQMLQQYHLGSSQQQQLQQLDIKGPAVPLPAQVLQPDTAKNSSVITGSVKREASKEVFNFHGQEFQTGYQKMPSNVPMTMNQVSGLAAGASASMAVPKLQIGNVKDTSNALSNPAYARALLIKQQQQLLQQYTLGSSQQEQELYIKGPALPWSEETPPIEPLGTRCQLCKLDVAFRPQGDASRDSSAPPVVAVLACHHAFHSRCIEAVYGLVEPSQCISCVEAGVARKP